ncbi:GntR family transcriptional regulator, partial [Bacillus cereus group sp. BC57]
RYAQVARDLSERIASGEYAVGGLLPTELELCERYGVSRHTVRAAIAELQQSGLVSRRKKVGTRVEAAQPHAHYRQALTSLEDLVQF